MPTPNRIGTCESCDRVVYDDDEFQRADGCIYCPWCLAECDCCKKPGVLSRLIACGIETDACQRCRQP